MRGDGTTRTARHINAVHLIDLPQQRHEVHHPHNRALRLTLSPPLADLRADSTLRLRKRPIRRSACIRYRACFV
jgi:hypothetical protein